MDYSVTVSRKVSKEVLDRIYRIPLAMVRNIRESSNGDFVSFTVDVADKIGVFELGVIQGAYLGKIEIALS